LTNPTFRIFIISSLLTVFIAAYIYLTIIGVAYFAKLLGY